MERTRGRSFELDDQFSDTHRTRGRHYENDDQQKWTGLEVTTSRTMTTFQKPADLEIGTHTRQFHAVPDRGIQCQAEEKTGHVEGVMQCQSRSVRKIEGSTLEQSDNDFVSSLGPENAKEQDLWSRNYNTDDNPDHIYITLPGDGHEGGKGEEDKRHNMQEILRHCLVNLRYVGSSFDILALTATK
ncbi:hypothetical protein Bbelb_002910 [Branchiostoma belcheri]|nr:hypothetical protein Bbelb_002910 [Branchiostoma belcheri]